VRASANRARSVHGPEVKETAMLYYALVFFVHALVAAFFGFVGVASTAATVAKFLFVLFLVATVVSLFVGRGRAV